MPDDRNIRPATHALDALIRQAVSRRRPVDDARPADALLFLGNRHYAFPAWVVEDPVLEPVDKLVWMAIYLSARATGTQSVFPSYDDIARLANVSSTSTVSRAIAILRATRWLSLCARSRDTGGRFSGNVYALHDEPLPLVDALHLDPGYMTFLKEAINHHHARVRRVVTAVSSSLDEDIESGRDVLAPEHVIERRLEAIRGLQDRGARRYFSFSAKVLSTLTNGRPRPGRLIQDQNSKAVDYRLRNSKAASCSSNNINTTTTSKTVLANSARAPAWLEKLIFPTRLDDNHRALAARYLARIPNNQRQAVLDELEGRLQAELKGAKPVYDALRYLHQLCLAVNRGGFHPNLGLQVQQDRERRWRERARSRDVPEVGEHPRPPRKPRANPLTEIRKQLGLPPSPTQKSR